MKINKQDRRLAIFAMIAKFRYDSENAYGPS